MATMTKRVNGWLVQVRKKGYKPVSKLFTKKADATAWASVIESEMERGIFQSRTESERTSLKEILERYETEVLPSKRSQQQVRSQIKLITHALGYYSLAALTPTILAQYRDNRLKQVGPQTVKHDLSLLSRVFNIAIKEWGITLPMGNPVQSIRLPKLPQGRTRRLLDGEEAYILEALKRAPITKALTIFALETAMRRGELAAMRWEHLDLSTSLLHIPETKTNIARTIPLSPKALQVIQALPRRMDGRVFGIEKDSITQAFDRAHKRARKTYVKKCLEKGTNPQAGYLEGLRFHDLRHEAASRLFEKGLNQMEVASITGHKTLQMLKRYTHLRASDLVKKLA